MRLIKILVLAGVVLLIGSGVALASGQLRVENADPRPHAGRGEDVYAGSGRDLRRRAGPGPRP